MTEVRITGAAVTKFGRRAESLEDLVREAAERALLAAGGHPPDHIFFGLQSPAELVGAENSATLLTTALGLAPTPATRVETGPSSGAAAFEAAWFAVKSGAVPTALVVGAEKMTHQPTPEASRMLAKMIDARERDLGLTMPALGALAARHYLHRFDVTREDLALVPVKAHEHGARNRDAHFQNRITVEDALASPLVADPLRLFDCAPLSDGAAAVVLSGRRGAVRVAGIGHATDNNALGDRVDPDALVSFRATRIAGVRAFSMAHRSPRDVDVVEVHDAFSVLEPISLEDLGFYRRGEAMSAVKKGDTSLGGSLPVNVSGGLKARGHPVGATGVAQIVEVYLQLAGRAMGRQVDGARLGLAHNVGGYGNNNLVTLLEAA